MIPLNISFNGNRGVTILSNDFIDHYMKDANDAQIKIYLYILRMVSANLPTDITEIADRFNQTEKEVLRCLQYWERLQIMELDYDKVHNLTGIHFLDNPPVQNPETSFAVPAGQSITTGSDSANSPAECISSVTATGSALPATPADCISPVTAAGSALPATPADCISPVTVAGSALPVTPANFVSVGTSEGKVTKMMTMTMDYEKEKASYSISDIQKISNDPNTKMLIMVAEQYFARALSPDEIKSLLFIYDRLAFHFDLIDFLLQYCIELGKKSMSYIEQVAYGWYESGIENVKQAKSQIKKEQRSSYAIMAYLGKSGIPTELELSFIRRWTITYNFPLGIIEDACGRCVLATDHHRFEYTDAILSNWYENNVRTKEDIAALDRKFENNKAARAEAKAIAKANAKSPSANTGRNTGKNIPAGSFCDIEQHDYDFDAIEAMVTRKMKKKKSV
ncbi:MAG: DnaD domain protein [Lachnospiraceae bacterium]